MFILYRNVEILANPSSPTDSCTAGGQNSLPASGKTPPSPPTRVWEGKKGLLHTMRGKVGVEMVILQVGAALFCPSPPIMWSHLSFLARRWKEKRNERCYFPRFYIRGPGKSGVCPTRNRWSHMQISFSSHGVLWEFRVFGIHVNWRVSWTASSSSLLCGKSHGVRQKFA